MAWISTKRSAALAAVAVFCLTPALRAEDSIEARTRALEEKVRQLEEQLRLQDARIEGGGGGQEGAEALPIAGFDGKPFLQSKDGKFRIQFGARVQARYTYQGRDVTGGNRDGEDQSFGELERLRFRAEGHVFSPSFFYRLEWDGHTDQERLGLTDAYLQYQYKNNDRNYQAYFGAGQWKPYFGRQEKQSSGSQLLVDRSLANEFFNIDRNIGVWVEGRKQFTSDDAAFFNAIGYEVGITNGFDSINTSPSDGEFDNIPAFVAHIDIDVVGNLGRDALSAGDLNRRKTPGLTIGASFASDQNNSSGGVTGNLEYRVYQMAYDFVFKQHGFSLNGEYFGRWLDLQDSIYDSAFYTHGGYVEAGYLIPETDFQLVGRASAIWNKEGPGGGGNAVEAGGGFNYFISKHNLKFSMDVIYLDVPDSLPIQTERLPGHDPVAVVADFDDFDSSSANLGEFQGVMVRLQAQLQF